MTRPDENEFEKEEFAEEELDEEDLEELEFFEKENVTVSYMTGWAAMLCPFSEKELRFMLVLLRQIARSKNYQLGALVLSLVSDLAIMESNGQYLDLQGPTKTLSFPATGESLGELVISIDTMRREAELYRFIPQYYFMKLFAHAFAHLVGLDHGAEMEALEKDFMDAMMAGLQMFYSPAPRSRGMRKTSAM